MGEPRPEIGDPWPLVGRDRQLSALTPPSAAGWCSSAQRVSASRDSPGKRWHDWYPADAGPSGSLRPVGAAIPFGAVSHLLPRLDNDSRLSVLQRKTKAAGWSPGCRNRCTAR
ncbi:hypothetical protein H4W33_010628 [Kibdelosporangium phytohabitans]|nr:hypothetical protein [Kibdelosporangium phytohabitans]